VPHHPITTLVIVSTLPRSRAVWIRPAEGGVDAARGAVRPRMDSRGGCTQHGPDPRAGESGPWRRGYFVLKAESKAAADGS